MNSSYVILANGLGPYSGTRPDYVAWLSLCSVIPMEMLEWSEARGGSSTVRVLYWLHLVLA